jgi:nucleotide-binding universal stress UspA family protein
VTIRLVLCPVDFSETSQRALQVAAAIAASYGAALEVIHVVPGFPETLAASGPDRMPGLGHIHPLTHDEVDRELRRSIEMAGASTLRPAVLALTGRPHDAILDRARTTQADLLVLGTHGRSGFSRFWLGSVTEKVLCSAECPVLTVPPAASPLAPVAFTNILCAVDFSPSALKALDYALDFGRRAHGCVSVLYALEYLDPQEPCEHVDYDIRRHRQHFLEHARDRLHASLASARTSACDLQELVVVDRAYKAVLRRAGEWPADLIVMGAQGSAGIELMLYGSNTQHVVRAATCPVLTVRA